MCDGAIVGCMVICFLVILAGIFLYDIYGPKLDDLRIVELENGKYAVEKYTFCGMDETGTDEWVRIKEFNSLKKAKQYKQLKTPKEETKIKRVIK
jgi:hypothetical protein